MIDFPKDNEPAPSSLVRRFSLDELPDLIEENNSKTESQGQTKKATKAPPSRKLSPQTPDEPKTHLLAQWILTRRDQLVVAVGLSIILVLTTAHWIRLSNWGRQTVEIDRQVARQYDYRIDINASTWVEWDQLPGIGETLARRIVDDAKQNGPFNSIDEITRVSGIGPKTLEKIRPWLVLNENKNSAPKRNSN